MKINRIMLDLGWTIGRLDHDRHILVLASPSCRGDGTYEPAESVTVVGTEQLRILRDALNVALMEVEK